MRFSTATQESSLHADLKGLLAEARLKRGFSTTAYLEAKSERIRDYFAAHRLDSAVVALSGGIDSALVLGLLEHCRGQEIEIVAINLPVGGPGASGQEAARDRARLVAEAVSAELLVADLSEAHSALAEEMEEALGLDGGAWAEGQLVSYIRTPALYYATSLLTEAGRRAVICGTTNRDEGAYLGYFGKASDGMVDLQLISDLHKSEVYALARELDLPQEVLDVEPSGDMFDSRPDAEVFGAPYDFVELYLAAKEEPSLVQDIDGAALEQYQRLARNLEALHRHNAHKYLGASPAVHLDVLPSGVPGGWR